jgi:hypothetical protein
VIICDDFEEANFPGWTQTNGSGRTLTATPRDAERALSVFVAAGGGSAVLRHPIAPVLASGPAFVRVFVRGPSSQVPTSFMVVAEMTNAAMTDKLSLDRETLYRLQLFTPWAYMSRPPIPTDTWLCVEIEASLAPVGDIGYARMFLDSSLVLELPIGTRTEAAGGYSVIKVGISSDSTNPDVALDLDNYVLARSRVGCD